MNSANNGKQDFIKEIFILILLLGLIIVRFFPIGNDNTFIKCIGFIGVLVSFIDLYVDARRVYSSYDKFHIITGWAYIVAIMVAIVLALLLTETIPIGSRGSDIFTLLALVISLPEELYLNMIGKYIGKGKR